MEWAFCWFENFEATFHTYALVTLSDEFVTLSYEFVTLSYEFVTLSYGFVT